MFNLKARKGSFTYTLTAAGWRNDSFQDASPTIVFDAALAAINLRKVQSLQIYDEAWVKEV